MNQKGGVGKTQICFHLYWYAVQNGLRTVIVELDRQRNLSSCITMPENVMSASTLFLADPKATVEPTTLASGGWGCIGDGDLLNVMAIPEHLERPRKWMHAWNRKYDLCVYDCPPILGPLQVGALAASDFYLVPVAPDPHSKDALISVVELANQVRKDMNPGLKPLGALANSVDLRDPYHVAYLEHMRANFGDIMVPRLIQRRTHTARAVFEQVPVWIGPRGEGHYKAADEVTSTMRYILKKMGLL